MYPLYLEGIVNLLVIIVIFSDSALHYDIFYLTNDTKAEFNNCFIIHSK